MIASRLSRRTTAAYRLVGGILVASVVAVAGGVLLWRGMSRDELVPVLLGLTVLGGEYLGFRIALGSALHPAALFVRRLGARQAPPSELPETKDALATATRLLKWERLPKLYLVDSAQVNAFVTGRKWERVVGVTRGMVDALTRDEQCAVFATLMARQRDDAGVSESVASVLGPSSSPVPPAGVRVDFDRAMERYRSGDELGVRLLGRDSGSLARALRKATAAPGSIKKSTPAVADDFFIWPCGQAVTPQEEALEHERLRLMLDRMDAVGGRE